jgi:hypothetical protein
LVLHLFHGAVIRKLPKDLLYLLFDVHLQRLAWVDAHCNLCHLVVAGNELVFVAVGP